MRDAVEGRSVTGGNEASGPLRRLRSGTDVFVFDLDDTLYPRSYGLHEQMRLRVVRFIQGLTGCDAEKAAALHAHYYAIYGAVIVGLVRHHGIKPVDFLDFVHDIDVTSLLPSAELATALVALPGRRLIFTNGPAWHADRVLGRLGVRALFEAVCDIEASGFVAKPARRDRAGQTRAHLVQSRSNDLSLRSDLNVF